MTAAFAAASAYPARADACLGHAKAMRQLELFFGTAVKGRSAVAPRAWSRFLAQEVTPRFPQGLTVLDGHGQWRAAGGGALKEITHVLVILYQPDGMSEAKIEAIRSAYQRRFHQESVMRVDSAACVSF